MSAGPDVPARVVVVDDDRLIREMVRDAIGKRARVECCDSSEAALDALRREPADLIVAGDGEIPAGRSHPTLSLISLEDDRAPRNDRRMTDLAEHVDMPSVIRAADFGAAVARAALRGEAGPIALV